MSEKAPTGQVWMCGACGRWAVWREDVGDTSCWLNAALVRFDPEHHVIPKGPYRLPSAPLPEGTVRLALFEDQSGE